MIDCIFCKIANHEIPAKIFYEDEDIMAIDNIVPKAPVHILIIPKKHIKSVNELSENDALLVAKMILLAKNLAKDNNISEAGYRLIINCGKDAGQTIDHLHLHLLGGKELPDFD